MDETDQTPPWEPPFDGSEVDHLLGALDRQRATFRWKADGLDAQALTRTIGVSSLSLGSLLKHLACVEDEKFGRNLDGSGYGPPWAGMATYDGPPDRYTFDTAGMSADELYSGYDAAVTSARARAAAAVGAGGLDQQIALGADEGLVVSLRRLLFDLLEEYGRHTGHADLIRESIDGRTGEDPPPDWRLPWPVDPA